MKRLLIVGLAGLSACSLAVAEEASFATKPTAVKDGANVKITFAVSAATDVEVAVVDGPGKVVRHLAAGLLGPNAPAPLKKGSLEQTLVWDEKDDAGSPATSEKVRIRLGLKPALDRFIGGNPAELGSVRALACGPTGELYVFHVFGGIHPSDSSLSCAVFSREGQYLRTILPYPAGLPDEKLRGVKRLELDGGVKVPFIYQLETRSFVPGGGDLPPCRPVVARDGRLAFVGVQELGCYAGAGVNQVLVIRTDGSIPERVLGTVTDANSYRGASLALSPDEKTLYAGDVGGGTISKPRPYHVVQRFAWADPKPASLIGVLNEPGNDEKHLNDPKGIATDRDGNVYVADRGNDRVAAFRPDGSFLGAVKVNRPERVEVHPRTGAIYALGGANVNELRKFRSLKDDKPAAQLTLPFFKHEYYTAAMALDASADPPVI